MGGGTVPVPTPWGYKGGEVSVSVVEGDRVVAIPRVEDGLLGSAWNGSGLVEWGWAVVSLARGVLVQGLEVDGPPERPVLLGAYDHSVAPSDGRVQGDLLQHAKADVSIQACLDFFLPVDGDVNGGVAGFGDC